MISPEWIHCPRGEPGVLLPHSESGVPGIPGSGVVRGVCGGSEGGGRGAAPRAVQTGRTVWCVVPQQTLHSSLSRYICVVGDGVDPLLCL